MTLGTRTRLLDFVEATADANLLVEAGRGTGKTVLARQLVGRWPEWRLASGQDLDLAGVESSPVVVVDDVDLLDQATSAALVELAANHRLILLGRSVSDCLRSSLGDPITIGATEMFFDDSELVSLIGDGNTAASVKLLTAGWPAAVGRLLDDVGGHGPNLDPGTAARRTTIVETVLKGYLTDVEDDTRRDLGRFAFLPFVDQDLLEELLCPDRCRRLQQAGLPVHAFGRQRFEIPQPIRQALRRLITVSNADLDPLVTAMVDRQDVLAALDICAQAGWPDRAAEVLATLTPDQIYSVDGRRIRSLLSVLGSGLNTQPAALLAMARISVTIGETDDGRAALDRAVDLMDDDERSSSQPLYHEVLAELAFVEYQTGNFGRAAKLRDRCAELVADGETTAARARLLETTAGLLTQEKHKAALLEARDMFADALNIWNRLGHLTRAGGSLRFLVFYVLLELGHHQEALDLLDRAVASGGVTTVETALNHIARARCLGPLGRPEEAEAALLDAEALIATLDIGWPAALAHWTRAVNASYLGDGDVVRAEVERAASALGPQAEGPNGARFRSEAAIALARCDLEAEAFAQLAKAKSAVGGDPEDVALAEASLEVRFGDQKTALRYLARLGDEISVVPGAEWMVAAMSAAVHHRLGDPDRAQQHLEHAKDLATEANNPEILRITESRLLTGLLDPDRDRHRATTQDTKAPTDIPGSIEIRLFGSFSVEVDGQWTDVSRGHCSTLLKLLVLNDGTLHIEVAIDALWPNASVEIGRRRLRNILQRLRPIGPDLVERKGEVLRLGSSVDADYWRLLRSFDSIVQAPPDDCYAAIDHTIEQLDLELLPEDRYADWAEEHRVIVDVQRLRVLDHLAEAAISADDVDRAVMVLDRAIGLAPQDSFRAKRAATLLKTAGRDEAAQAFLNRAGLFPDS